MKALVVVAALAVAVAGWFASSLVHPSKAAGRPHSPFVRPVGPVLLDEQGLWAESKALRSPVFWAGMLGPYDYELTRTTRGSTYVRYLPWGVRAGAPGGKHLMVSTYPFAGAYYALKRQARHARLRAMTGPGGSLVVFPRDRPKNVYLAYPGLGYQIEIYARTHALAKAVALSGMVQPVR